MYIYIYITQGSIKILHGVPPVCCFERCQVNNTAHKYLTESATLANILNLAGADKVSLGCNTLSLNTKS
jgi:hypothetical protein